MKAKRQICTFSSWNQFFFKNLEKPMHSQRINQITSERLQPWDEQPELCGPATPRSRWFAAVGPSIELACHRSPPRLPPSPSSDEHLCSNCPRRSWTRAFDCERAFSVLPTCRAELLSTVDVCEYLFRLVFLLLSEKNTRLNYSF